MMDDMTQNTDKQAIAAIINYWFAGIGDSFELKDQHQLWYSGGVEVDRQIDRQFGNWVRAAVQGQLSNWAETAIGTLALVIVLDQFTRNIYRGSHRAFAGDNRARDLVIQGVERGIDRQLSFIQRSFFYMPLEHSESLADQDRCVELFRQLLAEVPEQGKAIIGDSLDFAIKHRDIIMRFGRFPHRNKALDRVSTVAEQAYLDGGGARFGQ